MLSEMTVLKSVQAFKEHLEQVDPNLSSTPPEVHDLEPGPLAARLMQDLPGQEFPAFQWRDRLNQAQQPLEAAQIVLEWIQHRQQSLDKADDLQERQTAEMPLHEQMAA